MICCGFRTFRQAKSMGFHSIKSTKIPKEVTELNYVLAVAKCEIVIHQKVPDHHHTRGNQFGNPKATDGQSVDSEGKFTGKLAQKDHKAVDAQSCQRDQEKFQKLAFYVWIAASPRPVTVQNIVVCRAKSEPDSIGCIFVNPENREHKPRNREIDNKAGSTDNSKAQELEN